MNRMHTRLLLSLMLVNLSIIPLAQAEPSSIGKSLIQPNEPPLEYPASTNPIPSVTNPVIPHVSEPPHIMAVDVTTNSTGMSTNHVGVFTNVVLISTNDMGVSMNSATLSTNSIDTHTNRPQPRRWWQVWRR